jgi:hypothetical protein
MDGFTAKGALHAGLDLIRRRPLLILLWAVLFLAADLATVGAHQTFQAWRGAQIAAGQTLYSLTGAMMTYNMAVLVVTPVIQAVLWTSAFRAFLRPNERGPLALGREDLAAMVSWAIVELIVTLVSIPLTVFVTWQVTSAGGPIATQPMLQASESVFAAIGLYWAAVAGTWACARGEIGLLRCWTLTRGRFWAVTGLVAGLAVIAYGLRAGVRALLGVLTHHGLPPATLQGLVGSPVIFITLAGAVITALQMTFVVGVVTSAYRARQTPGVQSFTAPVPDAG